MLTDDLSLSTFGGGTGRLSVSRINPTGPREPGAAGYDAGVHYGEHTNADCGSRVNSRKLSDSTFQPLVNPGGYGHDISHTT